MLLSCSDDDDKDSSSLNTYEASLVGNWVEDSDYIQELFHIQLSSNKQGSSWATNNGIAFGDVSYFTWSATASTITQNVNGVIETANYTLSGNKLSITFEGETITYIKQ